LLLVAGSLALGLALIGIVVPVLPTVPFLLVAAYCYARGSERFYRWLVCNRVFGPHLNRYMRGEGVSWKVKAASVTLLWAVIITSVAVLGLPLWARILLLVIALAVTTHLVTLKAKRRAGGADCGPGVDDTNDPPDQRMPES
jgi:hypothetical protein